MEAIAFITDSGYVYWHSVILTLAACVSICFFLCFYLGKSGNAAAGFAAIPLCLGLGLVLGRFLHWFWRPDSYEGFLSAMTDHTQGDYALIGVFLACFLSSALLRLLRLSRSLPEMLDCMALAGAAGISVGRLSCFFTSADRGQVMANFRSLPFAYPVVNAVSGATEYRFATFVFQALAAFVIFVSLAVFYVKNKNSLKSGDTCLIFLLCYGCSQVVLDSTRYDSLFFRFNGFVSIEQILGAVILLSCIITFSRRLVKNRGFRFWYVLLWLSLAAAMGGAGFMEYYVQRHGSTALFSYSVMSLCLTAVAALTLFLRSLSEKTSGKNRNFAR